MTSIVKLQKKGQLTIPNRMREQIGLAEGDYVQLAKHGSRIILEPAQIITRTAADELTPSQKRKMGARLAKGVADIKAGRFRGPFNTADEMIADVKTELNKRTTAKKLKRNR